jgi:selenocysteine lyase/cysteine desulfurase
VNAAQALGQIPLGVDRVGADFLCATSHKWLFGGYGIGIFYARQEMLEGVELPMGSWLSVENPMAMDNLVGAEVAGRDSQRPWFEARGTRFRREATALEIGAGPLGLILGLGAALALHEQVGIEATQQYNAALQQLLRSGLRKRGFVPNAPDDPAIGSGICVVPVAGDPPSVVRELAKRGVMLTPRGGGVRISTHVYNVAEDVERLLWAFDEAGVKPKR